MQISVAARNTETEETVEFHWTRFICGISIFCVSQSRTDIGIQSSYFILENGTDWALIAIRTDKSFSYICSAAWLTDLTTFDEQTFPRKCPFDGHIYEIENHAKFNKVIWNIKENA